MISSQAPFLEISDVAVRFGGITALEGVSFTVDRGQILGLIGPNGAGKTTMFNCISRLYTPASGDIRLDGRSIVRLPAHRMPRIGISRTFQNVALFDTLTVLQNVMIGGHVRSDGHFLCDGLRLPSAGRNERMLRGLADEVIRFLDLGAVRDRAVADLPFGTRKRVELARALVVHPTLLLLDEPAGGLNHGDVRELGRLIQRLRDERGVTVLLVEHHMGLVMSISENVVALNFGKKIAEGPPSVVRRHPELVKAYLGNE